MSDGRRIGKTICRESNGTNKKQNKMQNTVIRMNESGKQTEVALYNEYPDGSGFIIREMLETKNIGMKFQAGRHVMKPMRLPQYNLKGVITHHVDGDDIQKFELHGFGSSREAALQMASDRNLIRDIQKAKATAPA